MSRTPTKCTIHLLNPENNIEIQVQTVDGKLKALEEIKKIRVKQPRILRIYNQEDGSIILETRIKPVKEKWES